MPDVIEEFLADPRLVQLGELQKIGDEVLDVISLSENQHSDIMAWMFDPREGHGQGDEILRDLLMQASSLARADSGLDGRSSTARFFQKWSPSKIRTTSFGSSFVAREFGLRARERVDLFVVDDQNRFVLVIENKAGGAHNAKQLDHYRACFEAAVVANSRLREYDCAYLAIDREFDPEDLSGLSSAKFWLVLGYDWLKASADRALQHVKRGNAAARLVVSYCNRQTEWESPGSRRCIGLAADLVIDHPQAVQQLLAHRNSRLEREWLSSKDVNHPLLFLLQNKSTIGVLRESSGIAAVKAAVMKAIPSLPATNIDHGRVWLELSPRNWEQYRADEWWPVYLSLRYSDDERTRYTLALCWNERHARSADEAQQLRECLATLEPKFALHADSKLRRVVLDRGLALTELLAQVKAWEERLWRAEPQ